MPTKPISNSALRDATAHSQNVISDSKDSLQVMKLLQLTLIFSLTISLAYSADVQRIPIMDITRTVEIGTETIDQINRAADTIPPDGTYRYDIAFAEWDGKTMNEKVTVEIKGDSVKVIYEGDGQLSGVKKGEVLDEGILKKHKSGQWIITHIESDVEIDEIGGCTGGPAIIDLEGKKFWMC